MRQTVLKFKSLILWLAAIMIVSLFSLPAAAQSTGEVTGTVTDPNNAVIANAEVRLINVQTNTSQTATTNDEGTYRFSNLQPGRYQLVVSGANFSEAKVSDVNVEVSRVTRIDVPLQVGSAGATVTVDAGTQLLDTDTGGKGQIISLRQIENLPLQTKNPLALTTVTAGVVAPSGGQITNRQGSDGTGITSAYAINGGVRTNTGGFNEFLVDGISLTSRRDGVVLALPSSEAIQQFQVQSGGMSAEFGHTVGGVVNYVTKSGTNDFHGSLFIAHRGTETNARRAIPSVPERPNNIYNQFGGSLGGPLYLPRFGEGGSPIYNGKNRTYFFFNYDGSRFVRKNPATATVPTALMRTGNFSELTTRIYDPASSATPASRTQFAGNIIPTNRINPIGLQIMNLFPLPNLPGLANNYQGIFNVFTPVDNYTGRIDHAITENQRVSFKFTRVESGSIVSQVIGLPDQASQNVVFPTRNYTFSYSNVISPSMVYTASAGFTQFKRFFTDSTGNTAGGSYFGFGVTPSPSGLANVRPLATFDIYRGIGTGGAQNQLSESYQLNQGLSYTTGKHSFRLGADIRRYVSGGFVVNAAFNGTFAFAAAQTGNGTTGTGNAAASLLLGLTNTATIQQVPEIRAGNYASAFYINDDYKISKNLTLNLGLRYEFETGLKEDQNRLAWFDTKSNNSLVNRPGVIQYAGLNGNPETVTSGDYDNFAPRIGFAYVPEFDKGRTVIRGAVGAYYAPIPSIGFYNAAPGFETTFSPARANATAAAVVLSNSFVIPSPTGPQGAAALLGTTFTQPVDRNLKNPLIYQWNIGFQRELAKNFIVEVLYSGNRGLRLLSIENINLPSLSLINQAIALQQSSGTAGAAQAFLNQTIPNPLAGLVPGTLGAATITRLNAAVPFPQYGAINTLVGDRDSIYHSIQSRAEKRLSDNVTFLFTYTFSKLITNVSESQLNGTENVIGTLQNPYDLRDARAVSQYDRPHVFTGNVVYQLPFGKNKAFLNSGVLSKIIGGFQLTSIINIQSGSPLAITQSDANGLGLGNSRPDVIGDPVALSKQVRGRINANGTYQWINPAAYRVVNGRFGSAPIRDSDLRGPGFLQLDLGLQRDFNFTESTFLRFRAEAFNALNRKNLGLPEQNISSPAFGQISSVYDPRILQFGFDFRF